MDYWKECIKQALEEAGMTATDEQIEIIVAWVDNASENYGTAHGYDCIPNPAESEAQRELGRMKMEKDKHEAWVARTSACKHCSGEGLSADGWKCDWCDGKGRT